MDIEKITLDFEDGVSVECEILMNFEVDGQEYIALLPDEDGEGVEEGDVYLYRCNDVDEDECELEAIEDEEELAKVAEIFEALMNDEDEEV